jgi:DNA-binding NtrC family response regulator
MKDKKILIVDDEVDFGLLMKSFFSNRKVEVYFANSIEEGLTILEREKPEYVFLDNNLPDGYGWGKTEFILEHYPQTQLNLISSLDTPQTSASSFRILNKASLKEELIKMFD